MRSTHFDEDEEVREILRMPLVGALTHDSYAESRSNIAPASFLTQKQACAYLQVSLKKLQLMRRSGQLKFFRFGHSTVRYRREDLDEAGKKRNR